MSRRQRVTLTISVRIPVPAGKTQSATLQAVKETLIGCLPAGHAVNELICKIEKSETTYLN